MSRLIKATLSLLAVLACNSASSQDVLVVEKFDTLPQEQKMQIFSASYRAALVTLSFDNGISQRAQQENNRFGGCLIDRNEQWVAITYIEYKAAHQLSPQESIGAVVAKALAWKCGLFPTE